MFLWILIVLGLGHIDGKAQKKTKSANEKNSCEGTLIDYGLSCGNKTIILDTHNELRDLTAGGGVSGQPPAANMIQLKWDERIARIAQKWANRCSMLHDPDRKLDGKLLGQNLYIRKSSNTDSRDNDVSKGIQTWFDEVKQYGFNGTYQPDTGHYSQLIWATVLHVGCGFSYYKASDHYYSILVCNYAPSGNAPGKLPYVHGKKQCEKYELDNSKKYSNLCVSADNKEVKKRSAMSCEGPDGYFRGKVV